MTMMHYDSYDDDDDDVLDDVDDVDDNVNVNNDDACGSTSWS